MIVGLISFLIFLPPFFFCGILVPWQGAAAMKEKAMAPHSNTLAWKIPWTEEPGGLQSMG